MFGIGYLEYKGLVATYGNLLLVQINQKNNYLLLITKQHVIAIVCVVKYVMDSRVKRRSLETKSIYRNLENKNIRKV